MTKQDEDARLGVELRFRPTLPEHQHAVDEQRDTRGHRVRPRRGSCRECWRLVDQRLHGWSPQQ